MDKPVVRISVRNLVEFILRSGDLDNRGGSSDREAMQKGSRLHRKIQGRMGSHYRAEVSFHIPFTVSKVYIVLFRIARFLSFFQQRPESQYQCSVLFSYPVPEASQLFFHSI